MTAPSLDFLADAALVVADDGTIVSANAAARRLLGGEACGRPLADWAEAPEAAADLLRRAARTTAPVPGALALATRAGPARVRLHAARLGGGPDAPPLVVLHLKPAAPDDQFAVLSRRVRELDRQLRERIAEKAELERALAANRTLLRELQHRVKNNIQMIMTLIRMSARGRATPEVEAMVEAALFRLRAMAATQEALYNASVPGSVAAGPLLAEVVATIAQATGRAGRIATEIEDAELPSDQAHCLALIANELVTNAIRHGLGTGAGGGGVRVGFHRDGEEIEFAVADDGPGLVAERADRAAGLRLVRSLCQQIGGALAIDAGTVGATCRVRFPARERS